MTMLFVITWMLNVRDQTRSSFVTCFGPFTNLASLFNDHRIDNSPTDFISSTENDGRQCMELILCRVEESFCSPTHNVVPHISWHDPPCHKTTKRYSDFPNMVIFNCSLGNSGLKHGSVIVDNFFAYFTLSLSAAHVYMI